MIPEHNKDIRTVVLTIGLQGSGKTHFAKALLASEPERWRRINRDDLRLMLWNGPWSPKVEDERIVTEVVEVALRSTLAAGFDVVVDNTFLNARDRKAIHLIAEDIGNCVVIEKVFPCPLEECLRRNALRDGAARVPDEVIIAKAKQFHVGKDGSFKGLSDKTTSYISVDREPFVQDESLPSCIISDLDGTLALMNGRNPYDAAKCEEDCVNKIVLNVIEKFYDNNHIIFMSGRSSKYRSQTENWLKTHVKGHPIYEYDLFMRTEGDMRKDSIVKRELFEKHVTGKYFCRFVLDDRNSVCRMWREQLGLTVFQVAEGNF